MSVNGLYVYKIQCVDFPTKYNVLTFQYNEYFVEVFMNAQYELLNLIVVNLIFFGSIFKLIQMINVIIICIKCAAKLVFQL